MLKENELQKINIEATQRIELGDGVVAVIKPYTDSRYLKYRADLANKLNELLNLNNESDLAELEVKESMLLDCELADDLLENLENYIDLPSNWKELISYEDKIQLIHQAFNFVIDEGNRKFSLSEITVPTACYFNGTVARQVHKFRIKTIDNSSRYSLIKSREIQSKPANKLGQKNTITINPQDEDKAKLYDEMLISVTGFENDKVPLSAKVLVIDYIFATSINPKK